ncbi:MAG TPA: ParB-like protein [Caulobacteraceae bacterium]|nr:ParB-like protein [Caulobacteraceae bacterium]
MSALEPLLKPVAIESLRPTQITVGFREVELKRAQWRRHVAEGGDYLGRHQIPCILGPKERHYVIDHHHLALALHLEGVRDVLVSVVAELSALPKRAFWTFLDNRAWCHPYDAEGRRVDFDDIPTRIGKLADDPYRSLAGELRRAGGYAKDLAPYAEFLWADFLRRRIKAGAVAKDFRAVARRALKLAKSRDAAYLPGWCGPDPIG